MGKEGEAGTESAAWNRARTGTGSGMNRQLSVYASPELRHHVRLGVFINCRLGDIDRPEVLSQDRQTYVKVVNKGVLRKGGERVCDVPHSNRRRGRALHPIDLPPLFSELFRSGCRGSPAS